MDNNQNEPTNITEWRDSDHGIQRLASYDDGSVEFIDPPTIDQQHPLISAARSYLSEFCEAILNVPYEKGGILPSEMLLFVAACKSQGVTIVVESGRSRGYSTKILSQCLPECTIISFEKLPRTDYDRRIIAPNVVMIEGDSKKLIPHHFDGWSKSARTALLLDGPKGFAAFGLANHVVPQLVFYAVHDLCKRNEARKLAEGIENGFLSDDEQYLAEFAHLDEEAWHGTYVSRSEMTADSATLGLFPCVHWATKNA